MASVCFRAQAHAVVGASSLQIVASLFSGDKKDDTYLQHMAKQDAAKLFGGFLKDTKPDTSGYLVASFALAMKGVDMDVNLIRIVGPLKDANGQIESIPASGGLSRDEILPEDIPTALYTLYKDRHYPPALKELFKAPVDGAVAENRDDDVMDAMSHSAADVLRLATQDPEIYGKLWDIIDWNIGPISDRLALIKRLKAGRWPNPEIRHTAMRLASDLRQPKHRVQQNAHG